MAFGFRLAALGLCLAFAAACPQRIDLAESDAGEPEDAGTTPDAESMDASIDAGLADAGTLPDAGLEDAGLLDASTPDAAEPDDAGTADAGLEPARFQTVSAGVYHSCGILLDGRALCWGKNEAQQATAPQGPRFKEIAAGQSHTCGVRGDDTLECWGAGLTNYNDQPPEVGQSAPPGGRFHALSAGFNHNCALESGYEHVTCWGWNNNGQSSLPNGPLLGVSAGYERTCGIDSDRTARCWHAGFDRMELEGTFDELAISMDFDCGLRTDGEILCHDNGYGSQTTPVGPFAHLTAGYLHACAWRETGSVTCWGAGRTEAGGVHRGQANPPTGLWSMVSAGGYHSCGVRPGGEAVCWGDDTYGQSSVPPFAPAP